MPYILNYVYQNQYLVYTDEQCAQVWYRVHCASISSSKGKGQCNAITAGILAA